MKKLKAILSFVFTLGIICLGFSFAFNFDTKITASALSQTEIVERIVNGESVEKGGAIYLSAGSTYNMSGGEISGHFAEKGGALYISDGAVFTMTGGTITGNYAKYGGAIYVANGGECYINGGTITGNFAENAPAIYVETGGILEISDNALVDGNEYIKMSPTNINIYVDGTLSKTINATGESYILNEAEMPLDYEHCCGYFLDSELRTTIKNDIIDLTSAGQEITFAPRTATANSDGINIYTRTATDSSYFTFEKNTTTGFYDIVGTTIESGDVVLPKEYQGVQVSIGITDVMYEPGVNEPVFYGKNISSIILPSGLTELINYVFYYCRFTGGELIIPDSVTSIGNSAFSYCSGLTSVTIGDSVTSIEDYAFYSCSGLTSVTIGNSVTSIGYSAFSYCSGLTSVIIPNSVTSISNYAFSYCSGLTSITIGNSVTSIGTYAFYKCVGLTEVKVTSGNTTYEDRGKNAIIEKSTNTIIYGFNCTDISVLEEVTSIGDHAFSSCSGLTSVTIPDSVTSIGSSAFYYCSGLTSVYIPSTVTTITASSYSSSPFYGCSSSLVIYTDVANASSKPSGWGKYWNNYDNSNQIQVAYGCSLDSEGNIVTPPTINFYVDGTYHSSITKTGTSYTVQESEMPLDYESCCGYFLDEGLTTTIKNNTIDLSNGDVNLYTRTATDSSYFTFEKNTTTGFYDIVGTTIESGDVVLPKEYQGVQVGIGITDVMFEPGVNEPVFYGKNISSIILPSGLTELINYVFCRCHLIGGELIIPDSVTRIGDGAFRNCSGLTGSLIIPNSVTSIGNEAFVGCSGLTGSLTILNSVTSIGDYAFSNCRGLTSVIIPDSVTSIGNHAFSSCSELTSVTIPDSVTSIGYEAFSSCSGLTSAYIPSSVTTISASRYSNAPFYGCSSSLVIYTDVANASSKPSGWNTYWNYYSSSGTLTVNYGYTLEQYKSAVGLTFVPNGEKVNGAEVEVIEEDNAYRLDNSYLNEMLLDKREYIVLPKKQVKIA